MAIQYLTDDVRVDSGNYPVARPSVGGRSDGSWLVAWEALTELFDDEGDSFDSVDIAAHAFKGRASRGIETIINAERRDGQFDPIVVARDDGSYVVAYSSGEENRLPGTYAASTILSSTGQPIGAEVLGRETNYNHDPDVALLPGGGYVLVAMGEDQGAGQVHTASGEIVATFGFGFTGLPPAVSALARGAVFLVWEGFVDAQAASGFDSEGNPVESIEGIYAQVRDAGGGLGPAFLIAPIQQEFSAITAATLNDGRVAIAYTNADAGGQSVLLSYVDATTGNATAPFRVDEGGAGSQSSPDLAVLQNGNLVVAWQGLDGAGAGVLARVFDPSGSPDGPAFAVSSEFAGDQTSPSVAAIGGGQFVVAWQDGASIETRIVYDTAHRLSGEIDGTAASETLKGTVAADIFFFDNAFGASLGNDRIAAFASGDRLVTTKRLFDSNNDGIVGFGSDRVLDTTQGHVSIVGTNGRAVTSLEFDGSVESDGSVYYVYSRVGSTVGTEGLFAS